jgi:hypothetical protein
LYSPGSPGAVNLSVLASPAATSVSQFTTGQFLNDG